MKIWSCSGDMLVLLLPMNLRLVCFFGRLKVEIDANVVMVAPNVLVGKDGTPDDALTRTNFPVKPGGGSISCWPACTASTRLTLGI